MDSVIGALLDEVEEGVALVSPACRILHANRAFARLSGIDQALIAGMDCHKALVGRDTPCFDTPDKCPVLGAIRTGEVASRTVETGSRTLGVKAYPIRQRADAQPSVALMVVTDETSKVEHEKQLMHSQKMEAIGMLAGGITHYFKNVLTSISSYSELISTHAAATAEIAQYARIIERSSDKAAEAVGQLLDFARSGYVEGQPVDLNAVIGETMQMASRLIPSSIEVRLDLDDALPHVEGSAGQIEQALINLIINARDAMPDGGSLSVTTSAIDIPERPSAPNEFIAPGRYALVAVADTGKGIPKDALEHVYQPFYTTKPPGEGTGLGLAMTYRIIKRHRGYITLESRPGKGTEFHIHIPLAS